MRASRLLVWVLPVALAACGDGGGGGGGKPAPGAGPAASASKHPENLADLARAFHAAQQAKDAAAMESLGASVLPTPADLEAMVRPGDAGKAFVAAMGKAPMTAKDAGEKLFVPGEPDRTEIRAYSATTEQVAADAAPEFPGGMKAFAEKVAAPGRTWWVIEFVKPGESAGMKYTCFTKVGDRFVFVPKPWRSMR